MKTSSRALIAFGIGIVALVLLAVILVLTLGRSNAPLFSESRPEGIVQRYLLAIQNQDYPAAYDYLAPDSGNPDAPNPSYDNWLSSAQNSINSTWKADLGEVNITGDSASVTVVLSDFRTGGPFMDPVNTHSVIFLLKKSGSSWKITSPANLYWLY